MKFLIVPNCNIADEIDAENAEEAMIQFATQSDSDMNAYFKAIPANDTEPVKTAPAETASPKFTDLLRKGLKAVDEELGKAYVVGQEIAKEQTANAKEKGGKLLADIKAKKAAKNQKNTPAEPLADEEWNDDDVAAGDPDRTEVEE